MGRIKSAADAINTAAREIAWAIRISPSRTEEQASSLEETSSSMEEFNATVRQNADHAQQAAVLAVAANEVAQRAGTMVGSVVQTMQDIDASSRKIADIIGVIDSIAFQTNILAPERRGGGGPAGEQGAGIRRGGDGSP